MKVQSIIQRTLDKSICSGCDHYVVGPHACPGGAQLEYDIVLVSVPFENKAKIIKTIREITHFNMSLDEVLNLVDRICFLPSSHPQRKIPSGILFREGVSKKEACDIALHLENAGATVELI